MNSTSLFAVQAAIETDRNRLGSRRSKDQSVRWTIKYNEKRLNNVSDRNEGSVSSLSPPRITHFHPWRWSLRANQWLVTASVGVSQVEALPARYTLDSSVVSWALLNENEMDSLILITLYYAKLRLFVILITLYYAKLRLLVILITLYYAKLCLFLILITLYYIKLRLLVILITLYYAKSRLFLILITLYYAILR